MRIDNAIVIAIDYVLLLLLLLSLVYKIYPCRLLSNIWHHPLVDSLKGHVGWAINTLILKDMISMPMYICIKGREMGIIHILFCSLIRKIHNTYKNTARKPNQNQI